MSVNREIPVGNCIPRVSVKIPSYAFRHLRFAVVDPSGYVVSLHQHPDACIRFINTCARTDLFWIDAGDLS